MTSSMDELERAAVQLWEAKRLALELTEVVDSWVLNLGDRYDRTRVGTAGPAQAGGAARHVEEVSDNVAATCRYYGISRKCYYGWWRRYQADGLEGLKDRSSRPHVFRQTTRVVAV